jgi:hypothetical protein
VVGGWGTEDVAFVGGADEYFEVLADLTGVETWSGVFVDD